MDVILIKYNKTNDDLFAVIVGSESYCNNGNVMVYSSIGQHSEVSKQYVNEYITYRRSNGMFDRVNRLLSDLRIVGYDVYLLNSDVWFIDWCSRQPNQIHKQTK